LGEVRIFSIVELVLKHDMLAWESWGENV
jgi:hypothetical protein